MNDDLSMVDLDQRNAADEFNAALGEPAPESVTGWDVDPADPDPFGSILADPVPLAAAVALVGGALLAVVAVATVAGYAAVRAGRAVRR